MNTDDKPTSTRARYDALTEVIVGNAYWAIGLAVALVLNVAAGWYFPLDLLIVLLRVWIGDIFGM